LHSERKILDWSIMPLRIQRHSWNLMPAGTGLEFGIRIKIRSNDLARDHRVFIESIHGAEPVITVGNENFADGAVSDE